MDTMNTMNTMDTMNVMDVMDDESIEKQKGFTIAVNNAVRDDGLSLRAKGLYVLIRSYITLEDFELTKAFLMQRCMEGEKAFNSSWEELKKKGYLKIHQYTTGNGDGKFRYEYKLLSDADTLDGVYLFRYDKNGNLSSTNTGSDSLPVLQANVDAEDKMNDGESAETGDNVSDLDHTLPNGGTGKTGGYTFSSRGNDKTGDKNIPPKCTGKISGENIQNRGADKSSDQYPLFRGSGKGGSKLILYNNTNNIYNLSISHNNIYKTFKEQIDYDRLMEDETIDQEILNMTIRTAVDLLAMKDGATWKINGVERNRQEIEVQLLRLKFDSMKYLIHSIARSKKPIRNMQSFLRTSLYNAPDDYLFFMKKSKTVENQKNVSEGIMKSGKPASRFHSFNQRSYDYGALEIELVRKLQKDKDRRG